MRKPEKRQAFVLATAVAVLILVLISDIYDQSDFGIRSLRKALANDYTNPGVVRSFGSHNPWALRRSEQSQECRKASANERTMFVGDVGDCAVARSSILLA